MAQEERYQCPCCGYYTLYERGGYDICPVCFWEDDDPTEVFGQHAPERPQGSNHIQLWQARENFRVFGASDDHIKQYVRPPHPNEIR